MNSIDIIMNDPIKVLKENKSNHPMVTAASQTSTLYDGNSKEVVFQEYSNFTYVHPLRDHESEVSELTSKLFSGDPIKDGSSTDNNKQETSSNSPGKRNKRYHFFASRGYYNIISYISKVELSIAQRIANEGIEKVLAGTEAVVSSGATFTKGATVLPLSKERSPVSFGAIATMLDHASGVPCVFFKPELIPFTRNFKITFFDGCYDAIYDGDLCLSESRIAKIDGRKVIIETILYAKGIPCAKCTFFGVSLPVKTTLSPKEILEGALKFSKKAVAINRDVMGIFAKVITEANGDSSALVKMNTQLLVGHSESALKEFSDGALKQNDKLIIIETSEDPSVRPIGGEPAIIRHRVFYDTKTKKYSAAVHYSFYVEGPPYRVHGGAIAETFIDVMLAVSKHLKVKQMQMKDGLVIVKNVSIDYITGVNLGSIIVIPDIKYIIHDSNIEFTMDIQDLATSNTTNKLLPGVVEIVNDKKPSKL